MVLEAEGTDNWQRLAHHGAKAALHLQKWEQLTLYTNSIKKKYDDFNFYLAISEISKKNYRKALTYINSARKYLQGYLMGLN